MNGRITIGRKDKVTIVARELLDSLAEVKRRFTKAEVGPTIGQPPTEIHPGVVVTATVLTESGMTVEGRLINLTLELAELEEK